MTDAIVFDTADWANKGDGWELVTPETAAEYLKRNTNNYRKYRPSVARRYADAMKNGHWEKNGEPIVFNEDGILVDGQHRLSAIVRSGVAVWLYVIRGISRDVKLFNVGKIRSATDYANAMGVELDTRGIALAGSMVGTTFMDIHCEYDKKDAVEYGGRHRYEIRLAQTMVGKNKSGIKTYTWMRLIVYLLIRDGYKPGDIGDFFTVAHSGLPLDGRDCTSALIFRNMYYQAPRISGNTLAEHCGYLAQAIEDFIKGRRRTRKYSSGNVKTDWTPERVVELWHRIRMQDGIEPEDEGMNG